MTEYRFEAMLERPNMRGAWTFVRIPFSVAEEFGVKGQVPVKGTINGIPYEIPCCPRARAFTSWWSRRKFATWPALPPGTRPR